MHHTIVTVHACIPVGLALHFSNINIIILELKVWVQEPIAVRDLNSIFLDAKEFERGTALVSFQPLPIHYNHPIKSCSMPHTTLSPLS